MKKLLMLWLLSLAPLLHAHSAIFDVSELPNGKSITLGRNAVIRLADAHSVTLQATDLPQTLSFELEAGAKASDVNVFDQKATEVKHLHLESGKSFLYTFGGLQSILLVPEPKNVVTRVLIKSDKPLTLSR